MKDFYLMIQSLLQNEISLKNHPTDYENIPVSANECICVTDFNENKLTFKKGFKNFLGYENEEVNMDVLLDGFHPDDKDVITKVMREAILFTLKDPENGKGNSLLLKYRRRKKDGSYITVLSQCYVIDLDNEGKRLKTFTKLTDITFLNDFSGCAYSFDANNLDKEAFKRNIYEPYNNFFTSRELDIIGAINNGLTNKEIGERLFISEHTVASHRKNIFRKANCSNVIQLISFCESHGILNIVEEKINIAQSD